MTMLGTSRVDGPIEVRAEQPGAGRLLRAEPSPQCWAQATPTGVRWDVVRAGRTGRTRTRR